MQSGCCSLRISARPLPLHSGPYWPDELKADICRTGLGSPRLVASAAELLGLKRGWLGRGCYREGKHFGQNCEVKECVTLNYMQHKKNLRVRSVLSVSLVESDVGKGVCTETVVVFRGTLPVSLTGRLVWLFTDTVEESGLNGVEADGEAVDEFEVVLDLSGNAV